MYKGEPLNDEADSSFRIHWESPKSETFNQKYEVSQFTKKILNLVHTDNAKNSGKSNHSRTIFNLHAYISQKLYFPNISQNLIQK